MRLNYHRNSLRGWLGAVWNPAALWQELWWGAGLTLRGFYRQNSTGFVWLSGAQCWELAALHVLGGKGGIVGVVIKIHYWLAVLLLFGLVWNYFWSSEVPHAGTLGTALSCSWFSSYPTLFLRPMTKPDQQRRTWCFPGTVLHSGIGCAGLLDTVTKVFFCSRED